MSVALVVPVIRAHHFRASLKTSHAGAAASQRFTCDVSSSPDLGFDAQGHTLAADIFTIAPKAPAVELLALTALAPSLWRIRQPIKRLKLGLSRADRQDSLV